MCITLKGIIIVSTENNVNGVLSDYHTATIISSTKIQKPKKKSTGQRKSGRKKLYLLNVIINVIIIINTDIQFLVSFFVSSTKVLFFRILGWISFFRNTTKKLANTFFGLVFLGQSGLFSGGWRELVGWCYEPRRFIFFYIIIILKLHFSYFHFMDFCYFFSLSRF